MWHGPVSLVRWFAWSLPIVPRRGHASLCGYPVFKSAKETVRHPDKDHCLASEGNDDILSGTLAHGHFVMYVPGEPHMCNIVMPEAEVGPIKKICFKVISDQYWDEA